MRFLLPMEEMENVVTRCPPSFINIPDESPVDFPSRLLAPKRPNAGTQEGDAACRYRIFYRRCTGNDQKSNSSPSMGHGGRSVIGIGHARESPSRRSAYLFEEHDTRRPRLGFVAPPVLVDQPALLWLCMQYGFFVTLS